MGVFFVCCEEEGDYSWNWEEGNKTKSARDFLSLLFFVLYCAGVSNLFVPTQNHKHDVYVYINEQGSKIWKCYRELLWDRFMV